MPNEDPSYRIKSTSNVESLSYERLQSMVFFQITQLYLDGLLQKCPVVCHSENRLYFSFLWIVYNQSSAQPFACGNNITTVLHSVLKNTVCL